MERGHIRNISVIGLGYVGFVTSLCLASKDYSVTGVDKVQETVSEANSGQIPFYEPHLDDLLAQALDRKLFHATVNYKPAIAEADVIFITVGTPATEQGAIDLTYVKEAAGEIGSHLDKRYRIITMKSTVIPGTTDQVIIPLLETNSGLKAGVDFGICVNPEFLKEGNAVDDFLHPDRTVIGSLDAESGKLLETLFKPFGKTILRTNLRTAEMIKYANNSFLATKISFINEIANMCRLIEGVDVSDVAKGIGLDYRISPHFLRAGCGFGGSCFPKDLKELISFAREHHYSPKLLEATVEVNDFQAHLMFHLTREALHSLDEKKIAILGLAFKPDTSDMREAASVRIINHFLQKSTAHIFAYDPVATKSAHQIFGEQIHYCSSIEECLQDADACLLVTEWDEFRSLSPEPFKKLMKTPIIIDGRKIYDYRKFDKNVKLIQIGFKPEKEK